MTNKLVPQSGILDVQGNILQHGKPLVVKDDALILSDYKILASAAIDTSVEPKVVSIDTSAVAYDVTTGLVKAKTLTSLVTQEILGVASTSASLGGTLNLIIRGIIPSVLTGVAVGDPVYATSAGTLSLVASSKKVGYILTTGPLAKVFIDIKSSNIEYLQSYVATEIAAVVTAALPVGALLAYPGVTAPTGWLLCTGGSYPTATYPDLFGIIAYSHGGAGANFNVPDYRGMYLRGTGSHGALLKANGSAFAGPALNVSQLDQGHDHVHSMGTFYVFSGAGGGSPAGTTPAGSFSPNTSSPIDNGSGTPRVGTETRPVSYGVNWIIKS
jgi:hypothetical protein